MNVSLKLALKYIRKNKKRSITTIVGLTIILILIISILLLFNVYQNYMINLIRNDANWEVRFNNIKFQKLYGLTENSDIKDIAVVQNVSEDIINVNYTKDAITKNICLKAYNEEAFKNFGIKLIEGNFPKNSNEIVISRNFLEDINKIIINNKEYTIVGIIEPTADDKVNFSGMSIGAITYLDTNQLKNNDLIDVSINFNDVINVYEKADEISNVLKLYQDDIAKSQNLNFNTELLRYYSIWEMDNENDRQIIVITVVLILIILLIAIVMIYSIFNISIQERKEEFAVLNSIGTTKSQIVKMILYEALILLVISIIIGILLSIVFLQLIVNYISNVLTLIDMNLTNAYENILIDIPLKYILMSIILISVTTIFCALIPIIKSRNNIIADVIKGNEYKKINNKVIDKKLKKVEQILTYRSQKQNPQKYITIVISVLVSIMLFLTIQGYTVNFSRFLDEKTRNYSVTVDEKYAEEVKQSFIQTGSCDKIYSYIMYPYFTQLEDEQINDSLKQALTNLPSLKKQIFFTSIENELNVYTYALSDNDFKEYLREIGVKELKENECIIVNYSNVKTDYYTGINITNLRENEYIELYLNSKGDGTFQINSIDSFNNLENNNFTPYGDNQKKVNLKIAKVVSTLPNGVRQPSDSIPYLAIIVKEDELNNIQKYLINADSEEDNYQGFSTEIDVYSENREELDNILKEISNKYNLQDNELVGIYLEPNYDISQIRLNQIFIYYITVLIFSITLINIVNIVISDINARKGYFYILISIGMQEEKIIKMILKEYGKYFVTSLLGGSLISIIITYMEYASMYNHELYKFKIPILGFIVITVVLILMKFFILHYVSKIIKDRNIIENIKNKGL